MEFGGLLLNACGSSLEFKFVIRVKVGGSIYLVPSRDTWKLMEASTEYGRGSCN